MKDDKVTWKDFEVHTPEATWVCIESREAQTQPTSVDGVVRVVPDGIDYYMIFQACNPQIERVPNSRTLHLRTSEFKICTESGFLDFLKLVVEGQLLETAPWDRFIEVYQRD